jgi:hypothetical protein
MVMLMGLAFGSLSRETKLTGLIMDLYSSAYFISSLSSVLLVARQFGS